MIIIKKRNVFDFIIPLVVCIFLSNCSIYKQKNIFSTGNFRPVIDSNLQQKLPQEIKIYKIENNTLGDTFKAYYVLIDNSKNTFEFAPKISDTCKKPSQFYKENPTAILCINSGFFNMKTCKSHSLIAYKNKIYAHNENNILRNKKTYHPTRAAFGINEKGLPSVNWIYKLNDSTILKFNKPVPNNLENNPIEDSNICKNYGGKIWNFYTAIGGSPVLIKNGKINITYNEELISVDNFKKRPRTAIGYLKNKTICIIVVEGDNSINQGLTLPELAQLMHKIGCYEAINLDGGGSSNLLINQQTTINTTKGIERPVKTVLTIIKN